MSVKAILDPSRTLHSRREYSVEMRGKLAGVLLSVVQYISDGNLGEVLETRGFQAKVVNWLAAHSRISFPLRATKLNAFKEWVKGAVDSDVLQASQIESARWMDQHVKGAYQLGLARGLKETIARSVEYKARWDSGGWEPLGKNYIVGERAEDLSYLMTANFDGIKDITTQMQHKMARQVSEGMAAGLEPEVIISRIGDAIDVSFLRARLLSMTEMVRAHHIGTYRMYDELGVATVELMVETIAQGGACSDCEAMANNPMSLGEAFDLIPLHPLCKCVIVPFFRRAA